MLPTQSGRVRRIPSVQPAESFTATRCDKQHPLGAFDLP